MVDLAIIRIVRLMLTWSDLRGQSAKRLQLAASVGSMVHLCHEVMWNPFIDLPGLHSCKSCLILV